MDRIRFLIKSQGMKKVCENQEDLKATFRQYLEFSSQEEILTIECGTIRQIKTASNARKMTNEARKELNKLRGDFKSLFQKERVRKSDLFTARCVKKQFSGEDAKSSVSLLISQLSCDSHKKQIREIAMQIRNAKNRINAWQHLEMLVMKKIPFHSLTVAVIWLSNLEAELRVLAAGRDFVLEGKRL